VLQSNFRFAIKKIELQANCLGRTSKLSYTLFVRQSNFRFAELKRLNCKQIAWSVQANMQSLYNLYKVIIMLDEKVAKGEDLQANKINGLCIPKQV